MSPTQPSLRLLVIADDPLARAGLTTLFTERSDHQVLEQISSRADLSASTSVYRPEVIIWDFGWNAAPALERLTDAGDLGVPIIALLSDEASALDAYTAGARGLFLRSTDIEHVIIALPAIARRLIVIDPALGSTLFALRDRAIAPPIDALTARESEVLQNLAEGLANKAIAQKLGISENTVKFHVNAIMSKLGAQSRTDAVVRATRSGLVIL